MKRIAFLFVLGLFATSVSTASTACGEYCYTYYDYGTGESTGYNCGETQTCSNWYDGNVMLGQCVDDSNCAGSSSPPETCTTTWVCDSSYPGWRYEQCTGAWDQCPSGECSNGQCVASSSPPTSDTTPPSVIVSTSPSGSSAVTITATASDDSGISSVIIYADEGSGYAAEQTCYSSSCSAYMGPYATAKTVSYYVLAYDNANNYEYSSTDSFTVNPSQTPSPQSTTTIPPASSSCQQGLVCSNGYQFYYYGTLDEFGGCEYYTYGPCSSGACADSVNCASGEAPQSSTTTTVSATTTTISPSPTTDSCSSYPSCSSCVAVNPCGWSVSGNMCKSGTASGSNDASSSGDDWAWTSSSCPAQTAPAPTQSTTTTISSTPKTTTTISATPKTTTTISATTDACSSYSSCSSCTAASSCGWSKNDNKCKTGIQSGSSDGSASGSNWAWASYDCPAGATTTVSATTTISATPKTTTTISATPKTTTTISSMPKTTTSMPPIGSTIPPTKATTTVLSSLKKIRVDSLESDKLYIRNTGTSKISANEISVYVDSTKVSCAWSFANIEPGIVSTCTFSGAACSSGATIKATVSGSEDSVPCPKGVAGVLSVVSTDPENGATGVSPLTTINVTFDKPIHPNLTMNDFISVVNSTSQSVAGLIVLAKDKVTVDFKPTAKLKENERYTVTVSTKIKAVDGSAMKAPFTFSFTTAATTAEKKGKPDLIIEAVGFRKDEKGEVTEDITIRNIGGSGIEAGAQTIWVETEIGGETQITRFSFSISAGEYVTLPMRVPSPREGSDVVARVDTTNALDEADETNNEFRTTARITETKTISGKITPKTTSELLIEKDIGGFVYKSTFISENAITAIKGSTAHVANYEKDGVTYRVLVFTFNNRNDVEKVLNANENTEQITRINIDGDNVISGISGDMFIFKWSNNLIEVIVANDNRYVGEPPLALAKAYLDKYPSDTPVDVTDTAVITKDIGDLKFVSAGKASADGMDMYKAIYAKEKGIATEAVYPTRTGFVAVVVRFSTAAVLQEFVNNRIVKEGIMIKKLKAYDGTMYLVESVLGSSGSGSTVFWSSGSDLVMLAAESSGIMDEVDFIKAYMEKYPSDGKLSVETKPKKPADLYLFSEGETKTITVNKVAYKVTLDAVTSDSVTVHVDNLSNRVEKGKILSIGSILVYVSDIFYEGVGGANKAKLIFSAQDITEKPLPTDFTTAEDLLAIYHKLTIVRSQFEEAKLKITEIINAYRSQNDYSNTVRFEEIAALLDSAIEKIDSIQKLIDKNIEKPETVKDTVKSEMEELNSIIRSMLAKISAPSEPAPGSGGYGTPGYGSPGYGAPGYASSGYGQYGPVPAGNSCNFDSDCASGICENFVCKEKKSLTPEMPPQVPSAPSKAASPEKPPAVPAAPAKKVSGPPLPPSPPSIP